MASYKRKQVLIDSPLQLHMLGFVLALVTLSLALLTFSVLHGLDEAAASEPRKFFYDMGWIHVAIRAPMIITACLSILASGLVTLFWSHRFAGPLRVISAAMARLKDGDFSVAPRVRENDTHQDLVNEFAEMQKALQSFLEKDRHAAREAIKKLEEHPSKKELEHVIAELKSIGAGFKL